MTIEEIRKSAPKGATHYNKIQLGLYKVKYYKFNFGNWYYLSYDGDWYPRKIIQNENKLKPL